MLKLCDLQALRPYLSVTAIAQYLGLKPVTLHKRLDRGYPELTVTESQALSRLFSDPCAASQKAAMT